MRVDQASAMSNAIARTRGDRLDYRTTEALTYTAWMDEHVRPYIRPESRFLDVGCGSGKQAFKAQSLGARTTGIDCSMEMIRYAREIAQETGSGVQFVVGDYAAMPFSDGSFEMALFPKNTVECSYAEASNLAREIKRILVPEGRLILTIRDGLFHQGVQGQSVSPSYDVITGSGGGKIKVPGQGEFEYPTYFWTVAFAGFVFGQHLHLQKVSEISPHSYQLVFGATDST